MKRRTETPLVNKTVTMNSGKLNWNCFNEFRKYSVRCFEDGVEFPGFSVFFSSFYYFICTLYVDDILRCGSTTDRSKLRSVGREASAQTCERPRHWRIARPRALIQWVNKYPLHCYRNNRSSFTPCLAYVSAFWYAEISNAIKCYFLTTKKR